MIFSTMRRTPESKRDTEPWEDFVSAYYQDGFGIRDAYWVRGYEQSLVDKGIIAEDQVLRFSDEYEDVLAEMQPPTQEIPVIQDYFAERRAAANGNQEGAPSEEPKQ
jgi:hypothetical protein